MKITRYQDIPQFTRYPGYGVDVGWEYLEEHLDHYKAYNLNLDPDFQRGHVWTRQQQIAYVEYRLRGGFSGRELFFNHPGWNRGMKGSEEMVIVDGKQRLEAVRSFMRGDFPAFGTFSHEFTDKTHSLSHSFRFSINDLKTRAEVLQWYLDLNTGGTIHTDHEINRVREMLEKENGTK